jgi:hypothetical protein
MSPMPFWPSFEPWAKLTPVQVNTSSARIQPGGGALPSGALEQERLHRVGDLGPIDAVTKGAVGAEERVHEPHAYDGADQCVRT